MENFEIFEEAGKYILDKMSEFKDALSTKVSPLEGAEWSFEKGSVKTCKADETGRKPRCKVGVKYHLKVQLSVEDVEAIWSEFNLVFKESHIADIERVTGNEELLRSLAVSICLMNGTYLRLAYWALFHQDIKRQIMLNNHN